MTQTGLLIKTTRTKLDLSQKDIAKRLKVTDAYVGRVELGHVLLPIKHTKALAEILKLHLHDLLSVMSADWDQQFRDAVKAKLG